MNRIDWPAVYRNLDEARLKLESAFAPDAAAREKILAERASRIALPPTAIKSEKTDVIVFRIGEDFLGMEPAGIRSVEKIDAIAPIADVGEGVIGLINIHSELFCLLDPYGHFGVKASQTTAARHAILLRHPSMCLALACDEIAGMPSVRATDWRDEGVFDHNGRLVKVVPATDIFSRYDISLSSAP